MIDQARHASLLLTLLANIHASAGIFEAFPFE